MRDSSMAKLVQNWTLFHFGAAKLARRDEGRPPYTRGRGLYMRRGVASSLRGETLDRYGV